MTEKIAAPQGLGIVEEFRVARALTDRPLKATVPGPYTLLVPLKLGGVYRDKDTLLADLVAIVNAECRALVAAGADFIQIDEPHHGMYAGSVHDVTRGINQAVAGVEAKIAVHVCFGNLYGRPFSAVRDYRNLFPVARRPRSPRRSCWSSPIAGSTSRRAGRTGPPISSWAPASSTSRRSSRRRPRRSPSASARSCAASRPSGCG